MPRLAAMDLDPPCTLFWWKTGGKSVGLRCRRLIGHMSVSDAELYMRVSPDCE
jgi:hypothetical protein